MMSISVPAFLWLLMQIPSPVITRGMGRPAMNLEETKVRLNAGSKARITALVGENRMAEFIRVAVEQAITDAEGRGKKEKRRG